MSDADAFGSTPAEVITSFATVEHAWWLQIGVIALLVYEYVITFGMEVGLFWRRKITGATILFLVIRYVALLNYGFLGALTFAPISEQWLMVLHDISGTNLPILGCGALEDITLRQTVIFVVTLNTIHLSLTLISIVTPLQQSSFIISLTEPITAILIMRFLLALQSANHAPMGRDTLSGTDHGTLRFTSIVFGSIGDSSDGTPADHRYDDDAPLGSMAEDEEMGKETLRLGYSTTAVNSGSAFAFGMEPEGREGESEVPGSSKDVAFRGPAHSIHSNIQIVLPAPLAPELYPNANPTDDRISIFGGTARSSSFYGGGGEGDRRSVADPWLTGSQSRTPMRIEREGSGGSGSGSSSSARPSNSAGSRPVPALPRSSLSRVASASSLRSANDSASTRAAARARSQPPAGAPSYSLPPSREPSPGPSRPPPMPTNAGPPRSPPPPVPRIPSMYGNPGMPYPAPAGAMQADYGNAHGADPSTYGRGRPVRKPVPVAPSLPAGAAAPWDPLAQNGMAMQPMPVPTPMEYAARGDGRRDDERRGWAQAGQGMGPGRNGTGTEAFEPRAERRSSKLRKQRSSSRPGQVS
ncbi:hypothetical protein C2E23DRAFT_901346 [Lenzites betulinus]|nr:hypothetical protein C2E23DRAFT_901346 [Lenzites betulinus]